MNYQKESFEIMFISAIAVSVSLILTLFSWL